MVLSGKVAITLLLLLTIAAITTEGNWYGNKITKEQYGDDDDKRSYKSSDLVKDKGEG